jgi:hypothetical protein
MKSLKIIYCLFIFSITVNAQQKTSSEKKPIEIGAEIQLYPAGFMPTITANVFLKEKLALRFRLGGNFANRSGFSIYNDKEIAKGFGATFGAQRFISYWNGQFIFGLYVDGWNMWTAWEDNTETPNPKSGTTYNLVIQPWINAGYLYQVSKKWNAGITIGAGREFNVITNGKNVGEGWMGILTFSTNYTFERKK